MSTYCLRLLYLLLAVLALGCSPRTPAELKSPYQEALEAYYRGLDGPSLDPALEEVNAVLEANPGDLEARSLRAQIYFQKYRSKPDASTRVQLFYELRSLSRALQAGGSAQDWVQPRLFVTVGDFLLFDGYRIMQALEADQGNVDFTFWKAYAHFFGAYRYFAYTTTLAGSADSASRGLRREENNARDGLVRALAGIVESTSMLDPAQQSPAIASRRGQAMQELEQRISGLQPPPDVPNRAMLRLEASDQSIAAGLYRIRSSEYRRALAEACGDSPSADRPPGELWAASAVSLERAAYHYLLESLLTGRDQPAFDQTVQLMNVVLRQQAACP